MHRCAIAVLVAMLVSTAALAEIPQVIGYQGRVTDNSGVPVADGTYTMRFRIYTAETGGSLLWDSNDQSVTLAGGIFNVLLGESPQPALSLAFDQDYWLSVQFDGEYQNPRKRLGSVGYAYMASGLVPGTEISGSVTTGTLAAMKVENTATSGTNYGVYGVSASTSGRALFGQATATSGSAYGVYAISSATAGRGVFGYASSTTGQAYGVFGQTSSTVGRAVYGLASATTGVNYGVYGYTSSPSGYAGYFQGDARVTGDLTVNGTLSGPGIGDITAVTAGTGLDGGGASGDVTLDVEVPLSLSGPGAPNSGIIEGVSTATTGITYGVYGVSVSTAARAVFGDATAASGTTYGVFGRSSSTIGRAVYGVATATSGTNYGVYGNTQSPSGYAGYFDGDTRVTGDLTVDGAFSAPGAGDITAVTAGTGLNGGGTSGDVTLDVDVPLALTGSDAGDGIFQGNNTSTSGVAYGVHGTSASTSAWAVFGEATSATGSAYGVVGNTAAASGGGVWGHASASSGDTYGVRGTSYSTDGKGVYGKATNSTGTSYGVYGESPSTSGTGVYGYASATTDTTYGVFGESASTVGRGVYGYASPPVVAGHAYGVYGESTFGTGVYGQSDGRGVAGLATSSGGFTRGVEGESASSAGFGVYGRASATTGTTYGVYGAAVSTSGYGVYSAGDFAATGTKSCVVKTSRGPTLLYCQESPENWFEDFGRGQLRHGRCHIEFDPLFLETVTIDDSNPVNVFVQLRGDCRGVYVEEGLTGFDVIELQGGTSSVPFVYRVVAKRKGFETKRLEYCAAAERDSYLYPELREKELWEYEEGARFEREALSNRAE